jgi:integrase
MKRQPTMFFLAEEYLNFRRKLGFALRIEGEELLRFAHYADRIGHQGPITTCLAVEWAKLPKHADPLYWERRLDFVRRFAKYRILFDARTEIPPKGFLGPSYRRPTPHIYSEEEIAALLKASSHLAPINGIRPKTYATLFSLLACTGLRISEALRLNRTDVDLKAGVLRIRATKYKKDRLVPLHPSATRGLGRYAEYRDHYHPGAESDAFFISKRGTALKYRDVMFTFCSLRNSLGWTSGEGSRPPMIHGLRHTFAVRCLIRWYKNGSDLDQKISALSTYLGHVKVTDTYWYLTAVPDLLALISIRFEQFSHRRKGGAA